MQSLGVCDRDNTIDSRKNVLSSVSPQESVRTYGKIAVSSQGELKEKSKKAWISELKKTLKTNDKVVKYAIIMTTRFGTTYGVQTQNSAA